MKRWFLLRKKGVCLVLAGMLCLLTFLSACGGEGSSGGGSVFGKKEVLPSDEPWNHGPYAIMETEAGWYTSHSTQIYLCLRYYEKESGNTILLCNKPECLHESDDGCVATYRAVNVINTVLYDGFIYVYGVQGANGRLGGREDSPTTETVSLCLWRASLDGSSIDKVGTVFEAENTQNQKVETIGGLYGGGMNNSSIYDKSFIIHQGYAYLPYSLQFGTGQKGFQGGGLVRMELATGKTEEIYTMEGKINGVPSNLVAYDDAVYFLRYAGNGTKWLPLYRYSIKDKTIEAMKDLNFPDARLPFGGRNHAFTESILSVAITKDRIYLLGHSYEEKEEEDGLLSIFAFDLETGKFLEEECIDTDVPYLLKKDRRSPRRFSYYAIMPSPEGLLVTDGKGAYFYDLSGNKLGEIAVPEELLGIGEKDKDLVMDYKISQNKLYLIFSGKNEYFYRVLSCSLEDVRQGKGEWTDAYRIQDTFTYQQYLESLQRREEEQRKEQTAQ